MTDVGPPDCPSNAAPTNFFIFTPTFLIVHFIVYQSLAYNAIHFNPPNVYIFHMSLK
jgi:hypothetical protein